MKKWIGIFVLGGVSGKLIDIGLQSGGITLSFWGKGAFLAGFIIMVATGVWVVTTEAKK